MPQAKFSIVVPIYKVEPYLERCVRSLLNQTETDIEILLVDDESPDRCPEMCDQFAKEDGRVVVIHKENGGLSDARNKGIEKATGEYVIFVDSDDYVSQNYCEKLHEFTLQTPDVIVTDGVCEGGKVNLTHSGIDNRVVYTGTQFLRQSLLRGRVPMAAWLYVYRREFLNDKNLRFNKGIYHEDEEFTPRALLAAQSVVNTGIAGYRYIVRENSITTQGDKRKNANDFFQTCENLCGLYDALEDEELKLLLKDSLVNKYLSLFQSGRLYRYGAAYLHKDFIVANAYRNKTRKKALLYRISPRLYWFINRVL